MFVTIILAMASKAVPHQIQQLVNTNLIDSSIYFKKYKEI